MRQLKHSHGHLHVSGAPSLRRQTTLASPGEEQRLSSSGRKDKRRVCTSKAGGWVTRRTRKALGEGAIGVQERGKWENVPSVVLCPWGKRCLQDGAASPLLFSPPAEETLLTPPGFIHGGGCCLNTAEHSCQCRAVNVPGVGWPSGKMMAEEDSQNTSPRR